MGTAAGGLIDFAHRIIADAYRGGLSDLASKRIAEVAETKTVGPADFCTCTLGASPCQCCKSLQDDRRPVGIAIPADDPRALDDSFVLVSGVTR